MNHAKLARDLAKHIKGSRQAFAEAFNSSLASFTAGQDTVNQSIPLDFKVLVTGIADDALAFARAFEFADAQGWLSELLYACMGAKLAGPKLLDALRSRRRNDPATVVKVERRRVPRQTLQSITSLARGFINPLQEATETLRLLRQACMVLRHGKSAGTGVLVAPDLVLTAWHVVQEEFADGKPSPTGADHISVEFDRLAWVDDAGIPPNPEPVSLAADWLVDWSPCDDVELEGGLPPEDTDLSEKLDFALLRLAKSVGYKRSWRSLKDVRAPTEQLEITVFQHPHGWPLHTDRGRIAQVLPRPRFLHLANTLDGSSGGPCFDRQFQLVGLHHAGYSPDENLPREERRNRGIPAIAIAEQVKKRPEADPAAHRLWRIENQRPGPVIGRDDFQALILDSAGLRAGATVQPRIISVTGESGWGKSFCLRLLRQLLASSQDVIVEYPASAFPVAPEAFIERVLKACGADTTSLSASLPARENSGTTPAAWLRNQLVPAFDTQLRAAAAGRRVWLAIDDLDRHTLPEGLAREFLAEIYEQIGTIPGLRFLLLGFSGSLPINAFTYFRLYKLHEPTKAELSAYVSSHLRFATRPSGGAAAPVTVDATDVIYDAAVDAVQKDRAQGGTTSLISAIEDLILRQDNPFLPSIYAVPPPVTS